jgi:hypothetical protein
MANRGSGSDELAQLVARLEVALSPGDDLSVGWMIRCLDADDPLFEAAFMLVHISEEFELRRRGAHNQDGIDAVESSCHIGEEPMHVMRALLRFPLPFRLPVDMVLRRQDHGFVGRLRMDVKDPAFLVIDPDDRVGRHNHYAAPERHGGSVQLGTARRRYEYGVILRDELGTRVQRCAR